MSLSMDLRDAAVECVHAVIHRPYLSIFMLWLSWAVIKGIYRVYFHPLAHIPGPRLAAASRWYEFWFDVVVGGRWLFQIEELHKRYGPIVRINPFEVHISDPDFHPELFNFNPHLDKRFSYEDNLQMIDSYEKHRQRRAVLAPFFSRASVLKLEWLILEDIEKLCARLEQHRVSQEPVRVSLLYRCLTTDIIAEYCFATTIDALGDPEASKSFFAAYFFGWRFFFLFRELPGFSRFIHGLAKHVPESLTPGRHSSFPIVWYARHIRRVIRGITRGEVDATERQHRTVFHEVIQGKLPESEKTEDKMTLDAILFLGAGLETTGYALVVATFHILANPHILRALREELDGAWLEDGTIPPLTTLEKLPYLHGVIQEALRISNGATGRFSRVNRHEDMHYKEWVLPKGTAIAMSEYLTHFNADIFPDPWCFDPTRWLKGEQSKELEKYLIAFSSGARTCIAQQLARAELNLTLATVFHRFDMELYETTRDDVDMKRDYFVAGTDPKSKGLRIKVR